MKAEGRDKKNGKAFKSDELPRGPCVKPLRAQPVTWQEHPQDHMGHLV